MTAVRLSDLKEGAEFRKSYRNVGQGHWRIVRFLNIDGVTNAVVTRTCRLPGSPKVEDIITEDCVNGGPIKWELIDNPN